ncbi:rho-related GTP-binding protein RhoA-C-like [Sitophilus oryzae]|uniref:Rho-related GTP-binding protein RhoA-C-like n=1 Tax=Sitophilus oryzae TaxID=7048 RepID=A0A6J2XBQ7_SITOR|nr:rho-related GTP-binding protein RhoA-C-like [Sitophilus oryzae]
MEKIRRKIVVVGDGGCGKTSLLSVYLNGEFSSKHIPTIFDTSYKELVINDKGVALSIYDTAGEEDYDNLRPLSYPDTNVVLICYSIYSPTSLENVRLKWYPEVKHFLPQAYYILVGTKLDLRTTDSKRKKSVTRAEGLRMARRIGADDYLECSAKLSLGISQLFENALEMSLVPKKKGCFSDCFCL